MGGLLLGSCDLHASAFQTAALEESMALNHTAPPPDERRPPYLRDGDPFASKLSWEADLVAGFYLTIIGKFPWVFFFFSVQRLPLENS